MVLKNTNSIWTSAELVIDYLRQIAQPKNLEGMARYGIRTEKALGTSIPRLRQLAKEIGSNHQLAWSSGKLKSMKPGFLLVLLIPQCKCPKRKWKTG